MDVGCLYPGRYEISESPVWCETTGCLWWVNMVSPSAVYRLPWGAAEPDVFVAPQPPTGLVLARDGTPLVGSTDCVLRLDQATGAFGPVFTWPGLGQGTRCNEMSVDPWGNLWIGTMTDNLGGAEVDPAAGTLVRISPDGQIQTMLTGIGIPNTFAWTDDGTTLLRADSLEGTIFRHAIAPDGRLGRGVRFHGPSGSGAPDGSALALDGTLWNARWSDGSVIALAPDGTELKRVPLGAGNVTSACFAGPGLDCLVVTTARLGLDPKELRATPQAGSLMVVQGCGRGRAPYRFAVDAATLPVLST